MKVIDWEKLPDFIRCDEVREYYESLKCKSNQLCIKRVIDVFFSIILLIVFLIPMIIIAICIKVDSKGPIFFRQERVTTYGKKFRIHKYRTMDVDAEAKGNLITVNNDDRVTRVGKILRKTKLDEIPQLIDVLQGNMSFVGTRPEVTKYVKMYTPEMRATLLLPAGITSEASIKYKDEAKLIKSIEDVDGVYVIDILPEKMKFNLSYIKNYSILKDILIIFKTIFAVLKKE